MANSLNHIFRTIWSDALNTWIAVSEITSAKGKRSKSCALNAAALAENDSEARNVSKPNRRLKLKPLAFAVACCFSLHAQANPSGAQIVNGSASISQNGTLLTITNSPYAIINWQGFSIQSGETTNFIQQSTSSSILNRVIGPDPSALLGNITSNGKVFLINPAGILVGQGARIDVPSLVASTLNLSNADFLAGKLNFQNPSPAGGGGAGVRVSASEGTVINNGTITTPEGGSVYLIAPQVENSGIINTPKGETILAAGNTVQLIDTGTPGVSIQITGANNTSTNLGQILADSGRIGMVGAVVKNSGTLNANSLVSQGGKIFLKATNRVDAGGTLSAQGTSGGSISILADMQNGTVNVSGTLDASALASVNPLPSPPPGGEGTQPQVSGVNTASIPSPSAFVPSPPGGGLGRGNPLGLVGTIPAATTTPTGGQIETSAAHVQVADNAKVTTAATNGLSGTWLIDPVDFIIAATGGDITGATLSSNLGTGNVVIQSSAGTTGTAGDVNVNDIVSWSANKLTLNAQNNININANMNGSGTASLALEYGQGAVAAGNASNYFLNNGAQINLPAGQNFSTKLGTNGVVKYYTVITSLGAAADAATAPTIITLQGMAATTNLAGNYVLGANIIATETATWNSNGAATPVYSGFTPIGNSGTKFNGTFDGLGHTISNLTINQPTTSNVGLLGYTSASSVIQNVGLVGADVSGSAMVGGLVGYAMGVVRNSYVTVSMTGQGTVTGTSNYVGGLVGYSTGSIDNSSSSSTVNGTSYTGGLVGGSVGTSSVTATINGSFATGDVVGTTFVGGLAGYTYNNSISQSHAIGSVTGISAFLVITGYVGGLIGKAQGTVISDSYASGAVTGVNGTIGGLVGFSTCVIGSTTPGAIINSYATGDVSGSAYIGGLVGNNLGATVLNSHASGNVTATGQDVGGLVGHSEYTSFSVTSISNSFATGNVAGTSNVGGLVGRDYNSATVTRSYATGNVTGLSTGAGSVGGLVGLAQGVDISDSYASGSVTGVKPYTGGLVGNLINLNSGASTINNSYSTGIVIGSTSVGGLVGNNTGSTINNSFWDVTTSGQTTSAGGVGMNTAQMQLQANFTSATSANNNINPAWDFANTWVMYDGHTYPLLRTFMSPLTVTAKDAIKTYDGLIYSNANGVTYSVVPNSNLLGTVNFISDNPLGDINVNSYVITPAGLYSNQQGYIITYASGNLTVNPKQLSASIIGSPSKVYNGNTIGTLNSSNYSLSGFVLSEGATVNQTVGSYNDPNVLSAYIISTTLAASDFTANSVTLLSNYILPTNAAGAGTITPAPLTVSVSAPDKVYNGNTTAAPLLSITNGLVLGENVIATGTGTFNSKDVLTANTVTVNTTHLADGVNGLASNYSLVAGETATAHITPAQLTASVTAPDKVYDGNTTAAPVIAITNGLIGSETVTASGSATFNSKNVIDANLVTVNSTQLADGTQGGLASNYSLPAGETITAHISPASLSVSALRAYDGGNTFDALTFGANGIVTTGIGSDNLLLSGNATGTSKNVSAGVQSLTLNTLSLNDGTGLASNYTLSGGTYTGQITAKALTANVAAQDKVYDGNTSATPVITITSGLVSGENVLASGTGTFNSKDVISANAVTVTSTQLSDGANGLAGNYSLLAGGTTTAHITPKPLTATVTADDKAYDGNTTATPVLLITSGLLNGETVTATGSATFNSKDVLTANTVTTNSTKLVDGNNGIASNYSLVSGETTSAYIVPVALTTSTTALDKVYDGNTTASPVIAITSGLVNNETVSVSATGLFNSKDVLAANTVTISQTQWVDGANGGLASNYSLNLGAATASAHITAAPLTITATANNKPYDGNKVATPVLTVTSGVVAGELITVSGTGSFSDANVATGKTVTISGITPSGTNASNYSVISSTTAYADITAISLTASIIGTPSKVYDGNTSAILTPANYSLSGFVAGEGAAVNQTVGTYNSPNVLTANSVNTTLTAANFASNTGTLPGNYILPTSASGLANIKPTGISANANAATEMGSRLFFSGSPVATTNGGSYLIIQNVLFTNLYQVSYVNKALTVLSSLTPSALTGGVYETWNGVWHSYNPQIQEGL